MWSLESNEYTYTEDAGTAWWFSGESGGDSLAESLLLSPAASPVTSSSVATQTRKEAMLADHSLYCRPSPGCALNEMDSFPEDYLMDEERFMDGQCPSSKIDACSELPTNENLDWCEKYAAITDEWNWENLPADTLGEGDEVDPTLWAEYLKEPERDSSQFVSPESGALFDLPTAPNAQMSPELTLSDFGNYVDMDRLPKEESPPIHHSIHASSSFHSEEKETKACQELGIFKEEGGIEEDEDEYDMEENMNDDPDYVPQMEHPARWKVMKVENSSVLASSPLNEQTQLNRRSKSRAIGRPKKDRHVKSLESLAGLGASERRRLLNRDAAMRYRERRKAEADAIQAEMSRLEKDNSGLRRKERMLILEIAAEKEKLKAVGFPFF